MAGSPLTGSAMVESLLPFDHPLLSTISPVDNLG